MELITKSIVKCMDLILACAAGHMDVFPFVGLNENFAGNSNELPVFAEMSINFRFGENRALECPKNSKGHAGFSGEIRT